MVSQGKVGSIVRVHVRLLLLLLCLLLLLLGLLLLSLLLLAGTVASKPVVHSSTASPRLALDGIDWPSVVLLATQLLLRMVGPHVLLAGGVVLLARAQHVPGSHLLVAHLGVPTSGAQRVSHFLACWLQRGLVGHRVESGETRHARETVVHLVGLVVLAEGRAKGSPTLHLHLLGSGDSGRGV